MTERTCARCGAPLPAEAQFCPRCGTPVADMTTEERKIVTVLFADLVGSTDLAARLDPERFREVLAAFFRLASAELSSLRGRAEKFVGDAVMAVFGVPHAHDDDAVRAVRAGLIIRDRTARLAESLGLGLPLQVRIGVNSGAVATGSGPSDQFIVSGAAVNLAVRLQQAAEPGGILVGETTRQLTRFAVEFGPPVKVSPKGFSDEITAWPVLSLSPRSSRRTIPLVGRKRELALLKDTFDRAVEASRAHLITVVGEPGIGKSRLVEEFVAGLPEGTKVLMGRASEFEEDVTFAPLAEMIRRELGLGRDAPPDALRERLAEVVTGCCDPSETEQVVARLGLTLGLGDESREGSRYRPAEIRAGFSSFISGLARDAPAVLVFEDLHIAQPALLDLIEQVVRQARRIPLLVLCLARDELLERRDAWAGGLPDALTLRLEPLALEEAKDLAEAADESLDDSTATRIALQAGGNPFFIIETTGMLLHERVEHKMSGFRGRLLPPTVQAVVASRIDHLDDDARDLVRKASVFARSTFSLSELELITQPKEELLQVLEDEELLVRDPDRPGVWRFRHDMLRDVAYESLPKRERLRLHVQVADGLAARDTEERYPQAIAYHLEQAALAGMDLDPGDRTLRDRAMRALARAGDLTRWRMESRTAIDLYQRSLALAGPKEGWGVREARILSSMGEAHYWLGEFQEAEARLQRALKVAGDDTWTQAHSQRFLGDIALNVHGDPDSAGASFDRSLEAARRLDDPWALARTLLMAGWAPYWRGDLSGARAMFEEALEVTRGNKEGDSWAEARALVSLASVISPVGDEVECMELGGRALALGRDMGDPFTVAVAQENVGNSLRRMWRLEEALPHLDQAVRAFRDLGARWELASALGDRGAIHRLSGQFEQAEGDMREAFALCRELSERSLITWTASELSRVLLARGELSAAREILDEPSVEPPAGDLGSKGSLLVAQALLALAEGDGAHAVALSLEALDLARREGWPNPVSARIWWVGNLFGAETVGGEEAMEQARRTLEGAHWIQALKEPELAKAR